MKRLVILGMLILAVASIARAQDPCPQCNKAYEEVTSPPFHVNDDNRLPPRRRTSPFSMRFDASVVFTNNSPKKIKQITWASTLIDTATKQTISTYTFVTRKRIAPYQVVTLRKKVQVPLDPRVLSPYQSNRVKRGAPNVFRTEQVSTIKKIEYTDGSVSTP